MIRVFIYINNKLKIDSQFIFNGLIRLIHPYSPLVLRTREWLQGYYYFFFLKKKEWERSLKFLENFMEIREDMTYKTGGIVFKCNKGL